MSEEKSLNKSTLAFIAIAAGLIGMLLGYSVTDKSAASPAATPTQSASTVSTASTGAAGALAYRYIADSEFTSIKRDEFGRAAPYNIGENIQTSDKAFKELTMEIELPLDATVEYKLLMDQGDAAVYEWSVDDGEVYTDIPISMLTHLVKVNFLPAIQKQKVIRIRALLLPPTLVNMAGFG